MALATTSQSVDRITDGDANLKFQVTSGRLRFIHPVRVHGISWGWAHQRAVRDPRVAMAVFTPADLVKPQTAKLYAAGADFTREAVTVDQIVGEIQFQAIDSTASLAIADLVFLLQRDDAGGQE